MFHGLLRDIATYMHSSKHFLLATLIFQGTSKTPGLGRPTVFVMTGSDSESKSDSVSKLSEITMTYAADWGGGERSGVDESNLMFRL